MEVFAKKTASFSSGLRPPQDINKGPRHRKARFTRNQETNYINHGKANQEFDYK
ncbi:hypothetical protein QJS10_CPB18g01941 [Acorus calamus]|uniref:Uncharacterized protein n=1 Tax=Acorus calamus TaxID=4465 RepID=A0AAV9CQ96_ACOCL|nr:hypothetical protein QJS10_CPB18g01941 [Acorus calamus]